MYIKVQKLFKGGNNSGAETIRRNTIDGLIKQIGKKIQEATGEKLSTFYLKQRISMAIQKGNAVCVRGCPKKTSPGLEGLFNFHVQEAEML